ncbi:hypothetical protein [uncultured Cohaesibacter sp.]|uniref:hypothetical protein n=1 Tax=uncultured Cohaesibacter sp. TaxID=1002546 RepID=UPI002AA665D8|nr:hypothetical protein [uncultured Cohaesibacter sp.]
MKSPIAPSRLAEETENYLEAGQFDRLTQTQFTHIFRRHFGAAPISDRIAIAQKLCGMRAVPHDVVLLLCCDVDAVAGPVLTHSPLLSAAELTIQLLQGNCATREAIAQRTDLTPILISQLLLFEEPSVARHLAKNTRVHPVISAPMQAKIERIGAIEFVQLEPKAMSQETEKLDALVSSMEQDWCAHYKPDALGEDLSSTAPKESAPAALEGEPSETLPPLATKPVDTDLETVAPMHDDALLLDAEDIKLLDQLSESDWDALDDDAIEALAKQLAEADQSQLEDAFPEEESNETVYGAAAVVVGQYTPIVSADADPLPTLPASDIVISSDEDTALSEEQTDDFEMIVSAPAATKAEFEEETGPASFTIGAFDSENADFPLLRTPLADNEREAVISFGPAGVVEEEEVHLPSSYVAPDDDVDFEACEKTSFVISAEEPPLAELLPPMQDEALQAEETTSSAANAATAPFGTSPLDDLQSALKRPLDQQEAKLLAQASRKLANGAIGEPLSKDPVTSRSSERKPQITLTIRKSSKSDVSPEKNSEKEKAETKTDVQSQSRASELAASATPDTSPDSDLTIPRATHLTSATEDDWKRALARLTGDLPASEEDEDAPRIFSVPKSQSEASQTQAKSSNPLSHMSTMGLEKVVEAIESELSLESIAGTDEGAVFTHGDEPAASDEATVGEEYFPSDDISIASKNTDQPVIAEPLPIPHGSPLSAKEEEAKHEAPLAHEHAPLGFMPDMISFADLELIEAEPDLPSVSDLLIKKSARAVPHVELIEPIEIDILENGRITALEDLETTPMQVISEQLEAQRAALNSLHQKMKDYEDASRKSEITHFHSNATQEDSGASTPANELNAKSEADDISSLPELSAHKLVDVEAYQALKETENSLSEETIQDSSSNEDDETDPVDLASMALNATARDGMANSFYAYDAETRLTILQSIIAKTIADAALQAEDDQSRSMLDDFTVQELVAARFSNDRIRTADLMHDISGHRRLDMTQLLQDRGGEALVVYLYSIGMDESSTLSILLHGPDAIAHDFEKITQLMTLYHQLYPAAARKITTQLFGQPRTTASTQYAPIHDEGAGKNAPRMRKTGVKDTSDASNMAVREASAMPGFGRRLKRP